MAERKTGLSSITALPSTAEAVAIAVKQNDGQDQTPKIIAGGRGRVAEQILEVAFSNGIKVREDADLAQMLSVIDIDSEIPVEAFATVAEILTYVYEANYAMKPKPNANKRASDTLTTDELVASWVANKGEKDD
jgi:flagellar biosynthesis protein